MPGLDLTLGSLDVDVDVDVDLDLDLNLGGSVDEPDPLAGYQYTGDVEADSAAEMSAVKSAFIARAKAEDKRRRKATDSEYWFCICFQSREQVEEFLRQTAWADPRDKYLDGQKVAKKLGVALTPEPPQPARATHNKRLTKLAMEK